LKAEGIRGLYKGFGVHVCGSIPAAGFYFPCELYMSNKLILRISTC
jgi:hypothetical protein